MNHFHGDVAVFNYAGRNGRFCSRGVESLPPWLSQVARRVALTAPRCSEFDTSLRNFSWQMESSNIFAGILDGASRSTRWAS